MDLIHQLWYLVICVDTIHTSISPCTSLFEWKLPVGHLGLGRNPFSAGGFILVVLGLNVHNNGKQMSLDNPAMEDFPRVCVATMASVRSVVGNDLDMSRTCTIP